MNLVSTVLFGIPVLLFVTMLGMLTLGYRIGRVQVERDGAHPSAGVIEAAIFSLLGLLLAFQFGSSSGRLEKRREQAVAEVNLIGTAYLRVDILYPEHQPPLRRLLRDYVDARIRMNDAVPDLERMHAEKATLQTVQLEIWARSVGACRGDPRPSTCMLLLGAINPMIDVTTSRWVSAMTHAPVPLIAFLLAVVLMGALLAGHVMSRGPRSLFHMVVMAAMFASTMHVIIDLEFPRVGGIRIGPPDDAMHALRDRLRGLAKGVEGQ